MYQCFALKHQGEISKHFHDLTCVLDRDDVIVLSSPVGARVDEIRKGTHWFAHYAAYKVLPKSGLYNIVIVEKEDGQEYYCNLAGAPIIDGLNVRYIDYDIDIILSPQNELSVHDVAEFHERRHIFGYPDQLVADILACQAEVEAALRSRSGYCDPAFYQALKRIKAE